MILVTGATGKVGGQAVAQLLEAGAAVRALTRNPSSARLPEGAEIVPGDLADPGSLDTALDGVDSVFLVWPTLSADHAREEHAPENGTARINGRPKGRPEDSRYAWWVSMER
ncbi:NAD(P)H-binding protein [Streptosporangium sp. NBC_01755]|uniref:SDR family oxidoreductase n=1 Tax=unclassified Streptosporangium TaxID=2632669 RepID=UPI002DD93317|nr:MULTISPECIES: NAD(P)H-binding protein [unclassified Streptosporangium]WSA25947.1 NAD(P)H-binding protein [Streptosporangium sp. NBC_01810]WSD02664.1 NAD(P)H-binding protein [Streptosporangium sp. NBC_01755]